MKCLAQLALGKVGIQNQDGLVIFATDIFGIADKSVEVNMIASMKAASSAMLPGSGYYREHPTCPHCHAKLTFDETVNRLTNVSQARWHVIHLRWFCETCQSFFTTPPQSHFEIPCPACGGQDQDCGLCFGYPWNRA